MLSVWTIYDHPSDYPDCFVMRRSEIRPGAVVSTQEVYTAATLDDLRHRLPRGLYRQPRMPGDDPVIVETWF